MGLAYASRTDLTSRTVPDGLWYGLGAAGLALMAVDFALAFGGASWILVVAVGLVFALGVTGGEIISIFPGDTLPPDDVELTPPQQRIARLNVLIDAAMLAGVVLIFLAAPLLDLGTRGPLLAGPQAQAYSSAIMVGAGLLFYFLGFLHGGADAKAFMVLAVLFPIAPRFAGLPLIAPPAVPAVELIPFTFALFFNAAVFQVVGSIPVFIALSLRRGGAHFPESLFGYPKPVAAVDLEREFVMGHVVDGQWKGRVMTTRATGSDARQKEALDFLKARGVPTTFVTPKAPFMVFMLAGLVSLLLVPCFLFLLF